MKKFFYMTVDTETVQNGKMNLVYDIAYTIHNSKGIIEKSVNVLIKEVFTYHNELFEIDTFKGQNIKTKRAEYDKMVNNGKIKIVSFLEFIEIYNADIKKFNIDAPAAYNCTFDCVALNNTADFIGIFNHPFKIITKTEENSKKIQKYYPFKDLYSPFKEYFKNNDNYKKWCISNDFLTPKNAIKFTAESAYSYLTKNPCHFEKHLALSDTIEEAFIYHFLNSKKIQIDKKVTKK